MRAFILILITSFSFYSCYKESEIAQEPQIIYERPEVEINTEILLESNTFTEVYIPYSDQKYSISEKGISGLQKVRKQGEILFLSKAEKSPTIVQSFLIENDINLIKARTLPNHQSLNIAARSSKKLETAYTHITIKNEDDSSHSIKYFNTEDREILNQTSLIAIGNEISAELFLQGGELIYLSEAHNISINLADEIFEMYYLDKGDWKPYSSQSLEGPLYLRIAQSDVASYVEGKIAINHPVRLPLIPIHLECNKSTYTATSTITGAWASYGILDQELKAEEGFSCNSQSQVMTLNTQDVSSIDFALSPSAIAIVNPQFIDCEGSLQSDLHYKISCSLNDKEIDFFTSYSETPFALPLCAENIKINTLGSSQTLMDYPLRPEQLNKVAIIPICEDLEENFFYVNINGYTKALANLQFTDDNTSFDFKVDDYEITVYKGNDGLIEIENVRLIIDDKELGGTGFSMNCYSPEEGCGLKDLDILKYEDNSYTISLFGNVWIQTIDPPEASYLPLRIYGKVQG